MIIQEGQPVYFKFKDDLSDGNTPTEFGYVPDPGACDNIEYTQLVDQTDDLVLQFDLDSTLNSPEEIQSEDFSASTGWNLGGGWSIAAGVATITNSVGISILSQNTFDSSRIGEIYKVIIEVNSVDDQVLITGPLGVSKQLTEGTNTFFIKPANVSAFEIRALNGSSIEIGEVSVKQVPSTIILAIWDNDNNYQDEIQFKPWIATVGVIANENKVLFTWNYSAFSLDDGCYYFTVLDPSLGRLIGDGGLANGEFNLGNPAVLDLHLWTKTLGAGSSISGANGLLNYASTGNSGSIESTVTVLLMDNAYDIEVKINAVTDTKVLFRVGGDTTISFNTVGTHTVTFTPSATDFFEILFGDVANPANMTLDYVRITLNDGNDLFTNNASNKIKLGTHDCTHLLKSCPGEAFGFLENYSTNYRVASKITKSNWGGVRILNRLSTGERKQAYADGSAGREFTTDFIPYPEQLALFLILMSRVVQIDGERFWIQTEPDEFEPQYPDNEDEKASITLSVIDYDQILENKNCDGIEPTCS